mmetsp:Transcript_8921/g.23342  ORF Transcript_8921/g.23342 Transcript_8921/m.23342 type:complete len:313 (-) Transcript_8921:32-970(-)
MSSGCQLPGGGAPVAVAAEDDPHVSIEFLLLGSGTVMLTPKSPRRSEPELRRRSPKEPGRSPWCPNKVGLFEWTGLLGASSMALALRRSTAGLVLEATSRTSRMPDPPREEVREKEPLLGVREYHDELRLADSAVTKLKSPPPPVPVVLPLLGLFELVSECPCTSACLSRAGECMSVERRRALLRAARAFSISSSAVERPESLSSISHESISAPALFSRSLLGVRANCMSSPHCPCIIFPLPCGDATRRVAVKTPAEAPPMPKPNPSPTIFLLSLLVRGGGGEFSAALNSMSDIARGQNRLKHGGRHENVSN